MVGAKDDGLPGQTFPPLRWRAFGDVHGPKRMTAPARFRQSDLDRAMKAAVKHGYEVRIEGSAIRLLPPAPGAGPTPAADQADSDWDKRLGLR